VIQEFPISKALQRFRPLHGLKQVHAAKILGVSRRSVSRRESGAQEPEDRGVAET
jgi:DNA-binding XRE family transcriptional regulator